MKLYNSRNGELRVTAEKLTSNTDPNSFGIDPAIHNVLSASKGTTWYLCKTQDNVLIVVPENVFNEVFEPAAIGA